MFSSAIVEQSLKFACGIFTIGLILAAWMETSIAQTSRTHQSCSMAGRGVVAESSIIKTLTSPNYPSAYGSNMICGWTIRTSQHSGYVVELTFDDFRLESDNVESCGNHDYLTVYEGFTQSESIIGTFCGFMDTPAKVYSTGKYLSLKFVSDGGSNYKGFKLSYFALPAVSDKKKCFLGNIYNTNLELEDSSGTFQSPRYPLKYPKIINCIWVITVPEGKQIKLSFEKFDVEWSANCNEDYVKVFDGQYSTSTVKKTLCGTQKIPEDIYSTGRHLRVHFSSDEDNHGNHGFKAKFEEVNPNVKILGFAVGATVAFLLCIAITCVIIRCRNAKRSTDTRHQAAAASEPSSTTLMSIQHPYPPLGEPPPIVDFASPSAPMTTFSSQPPPPYSYPVESPPPYPEEERTPLCSPETNMFPWQQQNQENVLVSHDFSQPLSL